MFKDKEMVISENERLKTENETLKYSLLESQKILDENDSLKQQLEIKKAFVHFKIKTSKIVYREHDNWTQTFKIDIGTNDGVKKNQAVVHTEGLVGYISATSENESVVTTILDPSTSVSVNISTINEPAILKGDLSLKSENKLSLTSIPLDAQISINDMLYTSGLGNMYSASIPVGKIVEIKKNKNDISRSAIVEPCVSIRTISEVGVIVE
ncbi:cell shape-determining protein MreC [Clostridium sp. CAG:921]|nr:cell shape-determining protein MreC [Clostridium sp. CAG:921]